MGWSIDQVPARTVESWRILIDGDEVLRLREPVAELGSRAFRVASPAALLERLVADADPAPDALARHTAFRIMSVPARTR